MTIKTILSEEDYLAYLLYSFSKNKQSRANRRRSWLVISGMFFVIGYMFYGSNNFYSYYFFGAGVISLIFYPLYQRYHYKKHYRKFVQDKLGYRIGKEGTINFGPEVIATEDVTGESKINTSEVAEIIEISTHYFVKLNSGDGLVIPKTATGNPNFLDELLTVLDNPNIKINRELDWQWK
ncbi:hypothetical protein [Mucilaginibacter pedocola]|uniref:YcxB-like protein domain-containing protein n=1 Tax=Mucilaginibacter pedocola TaxID=1792845 RepID=A0A1S9PAP6_9SPHI|nr:hypothetical protein [Mucilaginibacter pedocola]OOQ58054.1 hypothetical protein BC343_10360 [Mucilaginibacter pedocola]